MNDQHVERRQTDERILIADDDEKSLTGLGTLLTGFGYPIAVARTPDEAVSGAVHFVPDVVIVALALADGNPAAIVQRLRDACGPRMPLLIALSGWGESQHRDVALGAGFDVHLVRPVGVDQLTFILSTIAK